jgi:hypothetical protein
VAAAVVPGHTALAQAAELLATVTGQDLEQDAAGVFRIARRVASDRVISTVDPQARHGHKTSARISIRADVFDVPGYAQFQSGNAPCTIA